MRGWKVIVGVLVALAVLVSACGGSDATSSDTQDASADNVTADEPVQDADESVDDAEASPGDADDPGDTALTADDLEAVVLGGWDLIWDEDFSSLLTLYTEDCQAQLTVADFEATLGVGVSNLAEIGIDTADVGVAVAVSDVVDGVSATTTSTLTFPGEDPSDENPTSWVVESDEWRRADCDEIVGAGDTPEELGIGSIEQPAAFGSAYDMDDWRATIIGISDPQASGVLASFSEAPPAGHVDVMVTYVALYYGDELGTVDPFVLKGIGSTEYASFDSSCALDGPLLAEQGISTLASALPGQQLTLADCLTVPEEEVASMVFQLEHAFSAAAPTVFFSANGETAPDPGARTAPSPDLAAGATAFGETIPLGADWSFQMVDVVDGVAEGLMSDFGPEAPAGSTHAVVIYEATYAGSEATVSDPFTVEGLGSAVYASLTSPCSVDTTAAAAAYDTSDQFEFAAGETYRMAVCLTVPTAELPDLVIKIDNVFDFEAEAVRFAR